MRTVLSCMDYRLVSDTVYDVCRCRNPVRVNKVLETYYVFRSTNATYRHTSAR